MLEFEVRKREQKKTLKLEKTEINFGEIQKVEGVYLNTTLFGFTLLWRQQLKIQTITQKLTLILIQTNTHIFVKKNENFVPLETLENCTRIQINK